MPFLMQNRPVLPAEGLEPTRSCDHWILSPARLPIPPRRRENVKLRNQRRSSSGSDVLNRDAYQEIRPFRLYVIAEIRTRLLVTQIGSSNILVQQVICFSDQFLLPKDLRGKFQSPRLHNIAQFPRFLIRQQQRAL